MSGQFLRAVLPIRNRGTPQFPDLSVDSATPTAPGLLSAADKAKLDAQAAIAAVATPLTLAAGVLDIRQASPTLEGSMSAADKATLDQVLRVTGGVRAVSNYQGLGPGAFAVLSGQGYSFMAANAYNDGTNWYRIDTSLPASLWFLDTAGALNLLTAAGPGAGPVAWTNAAALPVGQLAKLPGLQVPVQRLAYAAAGDVANGASFAGATWFSLAGPLAFSVGSATAWLQVDINLGVAISAASGATGLWARALFDVGTLGVQAVTFSSGWVGAAGQFGVVSGGFFHLPPNYLAAGAHTLTLQLYASLPAVAYCRPVSLAGQERCSVRIVEISA